MMGTAVVAIGEPMLDAFLDRFGGTMMGVDIKDVGKVAAGVFLMKRKGFLKGAGYALTVIGVRNIVRGFVGTKLGTSTAQASWC